MARVPISFTGRVKGGPARGGLGRECRFYTLDDLAVAKTLFRRETGGGLQPVVIVPNAGIPRALAADRLTTDTFVTVAIGQTGSFNVGDLIPIWNAVQGTVYRVITVITPATGRLDLDSALGIAFTVANGTQVNATDMEGHVWGWADDGTATWMQVKELGSNRLLAPVKVASAAVTASIAVQEEGAAVNSRPTINFIGEGLTAVDNPGNNRIDVTANLATTTTDGILHKDDKKRLTSQDLGDQTGAITINLALGHIVRLKATGNLSITLSNPLSHSDIVIEIEQDATGSRTVTWTTTVKWKDGAVPVATTTAGKKDLFVLHRDAADYLGVATLNF